MKKRKPKERRYLLFVISLDCLNDLFDAFKSKKWDIYPKDIELFRMIESSDGYEQYKIAMTSKEFPMVKAGERMQKGIIDIYDIERKIIFRQMRKELVEV